jgi:hypothetical protein
MDRKHFYEIPESNEHHPYLKWHVDPRLRRYVHQRIPDDYLPIQVLGIAQILVEEVQKLDLVGVASPLENRQHYTLPERNLSGSMTAFLSHILFSERKVRLVSMVELLKYHFQGTELRDVYQVSLVIISHPSKFLRNFQPQLDWYGSLGWYSHNKFQKSLIDELRKLAGDDLKRTNLGLLNRCSPSRLETCLKQLGERGERLEGLLLLHQCFQEVVVANQFITNDPQAVHYDALLARYRERKQVTDLEIVDREAVRELLADLGNMIRNDRQQIPRSLDAPLSNDDELGTLGDLAADVRESISLENCELQELALDLLRKNSIVHIASIPANRQLDKSRLADCILFLLYGLRLTQEEAGLELDCNQSTIGRRHDRQIARLAQEFYLGYHKLPATTQISIEMLDEYGKYIESLCEDYYAELAMDLLTVVIETKPKFSVVEGFIDLVETQWQFMFKPGGAGLRRIDTFVRERLR